MRTRKQRAADAKLGLAAGVAVAFVAGLYLHVENQARLRSSAAMPERYGKGQHTAHHQTQPGGKASTTRRSGPDPEHDERTGPQRESARPGGQPASDPIQTLSAVVTAAFTVVLAVVAYRQANINATQARTGIVQAKLTRGQRAIAAKQATISERQADIQQAVANLERPTLFVASLGSVEFEPSSYPSDGTERCRPKVQMRFANFGRTPAVLLGIEGDVFMTRKGSPPPPGWTTTTQLPTDLRSFQIVAAGEDKGITVGIAGRPIPAVHKEYYGAGQEGVFVWGRFVYVDPFGARLETRFGLVPGAGGEPLPGHYAGHNEIRTYTRDDPDAPHRRYGA